MTDGAFRSSLTGWLDAWADDTGGGIAFGSRSQLKREPKRKCWTTGNLERTSALYILIIPWGLKAFQLEESPVRKEGGGRGVCDLLY